MPGSRHAVPLDWEIVSWDLVETKWSETVICVCRSAFTRSHVRTEVCRPRLMRIVPRIMSDRFLKSNLEDDPLALVLDIIQPHTCISCEPTHQISPPGSGDDSRDKERKVHPFDIFLLFIHFESLTTDQYLLRRSFMIKR